MNNQVNQGKKFCSKCGAPLAPDGAFCTSCGAPVPKQAAQPQNTAFCTKCGAQYTVGVKFCPKCGNPASAPAPSNNAPSVSKEDQAQQMYDHAEKLFAEKRYDQALQLFVKLGDYGNAKQRAQECASARDMAAEADKQRKAARKKRTKHIIIYAIICLIIVAIAVAGIVVINMPFNITYELAGGSIADGNPSSYNMLTDDITLINPTKTGYTFVGWQAEGAEPTTELTIKQFSFGDKSYTAVWEANQYSIAFDANGGSVNTNSIGVTYDAAYTLPTPTRTGYTFLGWYEGNSKVIDGTWKKTNDINLVAKWTANRYDITLEDISEKQYIEVTFDYQNSAYVNETEYLSYGDTLYLPSEPSQYGYVFTGWYTDSDCTQRYDFTGTISDDMTLYAGWVEMSMNNAYDHVQIDPTDYYYSQYQVYTGYTSLYSRYHIYLVANETGNHGIYYSNYYSGSSYAYYLQIYNLTSEEFIKSSTSVSGYSSNYVDFECNAGDVIVISVYRYSSSYYSTYAEFQFEGFSSTYSSATAEFDGYEYNEGAEMEGYVIFDEEYELPVLSREGYRFLGWYNGTTKVDSEVWNIASDVVLTPVWEEIIYYDVTLSDTAPAKNDITVTFDYNYTGVSDYTLTLEDGDILAYPGIPTRSNYIFAGWYTDSDCTNIFDFSSEITEDMTLYAKWIYNSNGYNTISVGGDASVYISGTSLRYYAFVPLVSGSVTIYSYGSYDTYGYLYNSSFNSIASNDDGGSGGNFSITYNVTAGQVYYIGVRAYSSSTRGYITLYVNGTSTPTSSAVANCPDAEGFVYTLGETQSVRVGYGEEYTLPEVTREGYTFLGWYYGSSKVENTGVWDIPGNATLTPRWEKQ